MEWQVVAGNTRGHLSPRVLEWFGYEGDLKEQKKAFIKMLKRNDIEYCELTQKNKEISLYPTIHDELRLLPVNVTNSKFLIMEPDDLKMAMILRWLSCNSRLRTVTPYANITLTWKSSSNSIPSILFTSAIASLKGR